MRQLSDAELRESFETTRSASLRQYYRRILNGLCTNCNHPPAPGRRRCEACALTIQEQASKSKAKKRDAAELRAEVARLRARVSNLNSRRRGRKLRQKADHTNGRGYWPEIHGTD